MNKLYTLRPSFMKSILLGLVCMCASFFLQAANITGTVYNDANGPTGGVNGTVLSGVTVRLFAADGVTQVGANATTNGSGVYTFSAVANSTTFIVVVTAISGYAHVSSTDATPTDGRTSVTTGTGTTTGVNFGIQPTPTAVTTSLANSLNPGSTYSALLAATSFSASDVSPGTVSSITITAFPTNTNTITINGNTYDIGNFPGAGVTVPVTGANPTQAISIDPVDGAVTAVITYIATDNLGSISVPATVSVPFTNPVAFTCTNLAYQVAGDAVTPTTLYSYDVSTGTRTTLGANAVRVNAMGYNTADNLIWGFDRTTGRVTKMDATGTTASYAVPNLPADFNVGDMIANNYLLLYNRDQTVYYVVDVNPARATYLRLVEPTNSFVLDASPYGTTIATAMHVSDLSYNSNAGLLYSVVDPGVANGFRIVSLNPLTGVVTHASTFVSGQGIGTETAAFGSVFTDKNFSKLYAFANTLGRFYQVDIATNVATLISSPGASTDNDGASCPTALLSATITGTVFNDANNNGAINSGENFAALPATMYAYLVNASGVVVDSVYVNANGTYKLDATPEASYTIQLSTVQYAIGTNTNTTPINKTPPSGWGYTASGTGSIAVAVASSNVTDQNFGIALYGYIYIHKSTLNEESSIDFSFTGNNGIGTFTLNDQPTQVGVKDIGAAGSGRLYVVAQPYATGTVNGTIYYRDVNSSAWVAATGAGVANRIDGGAGGTAVYVDNTGNVYSYNGVGTATQIGTTTSFGGTTGAKDVANGWQGTTVAVAASGTMWRYSGTGTSWTQITNTGGLLANVIDVNPVNGNIVFVPPMATPTP